jgi:hypothetical protein
VSNYHQIGIECRSCSDRWKLDIPLTGNKVEVFATLCPCGAIIVGNYNSVQIEQSHGIRVTNPSISKDEVYLSNGNFDILDIETSEMEKLPKLDLE